MTEKAQLWQLIREWLRKQKHINRRVNIEALEYGPPYAEICTVGNHYTWADIFDDRVQFYTEIVEPVDGRPQRRELVITIHSAEKDFFKKLKKQLLTMLHAGNLNWPSYIGLSSRHSPPNVW